MTNLTGGRNRPGTWLGKQEWILAPALLYLSSQLLSIVRQDTVSHHNRITIFLISKPNDRFPSRLRGQLARHPFFND